RCILGEARGMIQPAILRRQFLPLTSVLTAAALTDAPIQDLDVGFKVHAYLLKTGVQTTTGTGGTNSYSSLSDSIVVRPKIKLDNVVIKDNVDDLTARTYNIIEFATVERLACSMAPHQEMTPDMHLWILWREKTLMRHFVAIC